MNMLTNALLLQAEADAAGGGSLLKFITGGGVIGYVIVVLSVVAVAFVVIHFAQIRRSVLLPAGRVKAVQEMVGRGDLEGALEFATLPANDCYYLRIVGSGLRRFLRSPFGAFEIKSAMEEAGAEETAKLYRAMDVIATIGAVAPLLGLLGTVQGMIMAFGNIATAAPDVGALALAIAQALWTTAGGLVVAIPAITFYYGIRNNANKLVLRMEAMTMELIKDLRNVEVVND
jgi:biopolymer transport protein ExbB